MRPNSGCGARKWTFIFLTSKLKEYFENIRKNLMTAYLTSEEGKELYPARPVLPIYFLTCLAMMAGSFYYMCVTFLKPTKTS